MTEPLESSILDILFAHDSEPEWLIKDFMLQGTLVCLAGEPAAGKSYVSYTIGLALAAGCEALSGIVPAGEPKRVLYFDDENSVGDRNKYLQRSFYGLHKDGKEPSIDALQDNFWPAHFRLGDDDWVDEAGFCIEQVRPHLIVFDTATACFAFDDENSNAEATAAIREIHHLMRRVNPVATALVLKHAKMNADKGGRRTMRGAKAWQGAADAVMFQVRNQGRPLRGGLHHTRLIPDKTRAYGLTQSIYITPEWTDDDKSGLTLHASYRPSRAHKDALAEEGDEEYG